MPAGDEPRRAGRRGDRPKAAQGDLGPGLWVVAKPLREQPSLEVGGDEDERFQHGSTGKGQ